MITPASATQRVARSLVISIAFLGMASTAHALPVFARKYQTSCQTCHIVFPKLNAFGEAFRLRGYRMPAETEEMVKQPPVSLGSPVYKKLWPQAVWPGEISSYVPLAVNVLFADVNTSSIAGGRHGDQNLEGPSVSTGGQSVWRRDARLLHWYSTEVTFAVNPR